jgi:hypothetical protein
MTSRRSFLGRMFASLGALVAAPMVKADDAIECGSGEQTNILSNEDIIAKVVRLNDRYKFSPNGNGDAVSFGSDGYDASKPNEGFASFCIMLKTPRHEYTIYAHEKHYLGGYLTKGRENAAYDGRDLSDGPRTEATWTKIMEDIVACELAGQQEQPSPTSSAYFGGMTWQAEAAQV